MSPIDSIGALRAGQDWDTFITILPRTVNISLLGDVGALGVRRPQFRLSRDIKLAKDTKIAVKAAVARTIGDDLDAPNKDDLNANNRSRNATIFTSLFYTIKPLTFAVEYYNMTTSYKDASAATDNRVQGSVILNF